MLKAVVLSDGEHCRVRQLGLFELDGRGREVLGPYRYSLLMATGQIIEDEYDIRALTYTPTPPDKPANEVEPNTEQWDQLKEWETYQAALAHEKLRIESYEGYVNDIAAYVLEHCLSLEDRNRIVTADDWDTVIMAATVPQLTLEGLAGCLADTFPGFIQGYGDFRRDANVSEWQGQDSSPPAVGV